MQATVSKIKNGILPEMSMAFRADDNFTGTGTRSIRALSLDGGAVSVVRRGANRSTEVSVRGQAPGAFEVRSSGLIALRQDVVAGGAAFFNAELEGVGTPPASGSVTAHTQARRRRRVADRSPPLHPGVQTWGSAAPQTVASGGGNPTIAAGFDAIAGTPDACKTVTTETGPGAAVYTMTSLTFTLMGLPRITATVNTLRSFGELVGRACGTSCPTAASGRAVAASTG